MSRALWITVGCPGSGKSTWAEDNLPEYMLRLERDRYREALFITRRLYHSHPFPRACKSHVITQSMVSAMVNWPVPSYAVTDTGLAFEAVAPFIEHARRIELPVKLLIFDRNADVLRTRNAERHLEHRIPDALLEDCIEKFNSADAWWRHPDWNKEFILCGL